MARLDEDRDRAREERGPRDARDGRIGVREVLADVAERDGAEERVRDRVADGVAVGVADEARFPGEDEPAEVERALGVAAVDVEPEAGAQVSHRSPSAPGRGRRPSSP